MTPAPNRGAAQVTLSYNREVQQTAKPESFLISRLSIIKIQPFSSHLLPISHSPQCMTFSITTFRTLYPTTRKHCGIIPNMADHDPETASERTPILGANIPRRARKSKGARRCFYSLLDFFGGGIYAPDTSTYDPIEILLNTSDPHERDRLTERWRDNRLSELSFIGVVVCLKSYISG